MPQDLEMGFGSDYDLQYWPCRHFDILRNDFHTRISAGIGKVAKRVARALSSSSESDGSCLRILISTLDALRDDDGRIEFFEVLLGSFHSELMNNLQHHALFEEFRVKFRPVLNGFLDRTLSSDSVSESVKISQLITCLDVAHKVFGPDMVFQTLFLILHGKWDGLLQSVELANSLGRWSVDGQFEVTPHVLRIVAQVVVATRERDDRWISLIKAFDVPDHMLRNNIRHDDSVLLSLLIHLTREAFHSGSWTPFVLSTLTQFDVCNTLPELQHEFCSLWNEIVREARRDGIDCTAVHILREIRHGYIGLHQDTDAFSARTHFYNPALAQPQSYPLCDIARHPLTLVISVG